MRLGALAILLSLLGALSTATAAQSVEYHLPAKLTDVAETPEPDAVHLSGYLGVRIANNEKNRLLRVNEDAILAGFRHRPGEQAWIGEHVGKWLHAATLAWVQTRDPALRAKLDRVVIELLKTQEPDGYLGTYTSAQRFGLYPNADWDVWVHKYNLIGLLTYYRYTSSPEALAACRKIGDLLFRTFGPGKKSILAAGTQVGMASTSVLEPMVLLYRATGEPRYLEFARYIVRSWNEPNGPRVMTALLEEKAVQKTANGKAYEMLSNLVGLCELARATGEREYLRPAAIAWEDVVRNHRYLTGTASHHEHFHAPHELPNQVGANVGETCVTVTWIQLNAQLLRLTGEARYGNELERSYYNHLAAAQRPDGSEWCYYTALEGTKPYGPGINCCVSSGPRGMALAPTLAYLKMRASSGDGLAVNLYENSRVTTELGGRQVTVEQQSDFPRGRWEKGEFRGTSTLMVRTEQPVEFELRLRSPEWAQPMRVKAPGGKATAKEGWLVIPHRRWKNGDRVTVSFPIPVRLISGDYTNQGRAALQYGPLVLAYDAARNPHGPLPRWVGLTDTTAKGLRLRDVEGLPFAFEAPVAVADRTPAQVVMVPFAEAGSTGGRYQVWLRAPGVQAPRNDSVFAFSEESRSRSGNVAGEIADGDPGTFVVTFDGALREEDWFLVRRLEPALLQRVVFCHGSTFHDGGWFDASRGKPRVEVQREKDGPWVSVGVLDGYPATTATDPRDLKPGQAFSLRLQQPVRAVAVRVIGRPASGDNPQQAFASCGELQAFAE